MWSALMNSFATYYGLDWLSFFFGISGMYLISEKRQIGFLLQAISVICAVGCSLIAGQFGFVISNLVMFGIVVYGYWNWQEEGK